MKIELFHGLDYDRHKIGNNREFIGFKDVFVKYYVKLFWERTDLAEQLLDFFLEHGLQPELDFSSPYLLSMAEREHEALAALWRERGFACAVHLPFVMPDAAGRVHFQPRRVLEELLRAVRAAGPYAPRHFVGHPYLFAQGALRNNAPEELLDLWTQVAKACAPADLYLENTLEQDPRALALLAARLPENCGVCFDVGHWHALAGGRRKRNLEVWLDELAPFIRHLHLHDNHGGYDEHLAPGHGLIDWGYFAALLPARGLKPGVTFETSFALRDLRATRAYLTRHPKFRQALGLGY